MALRRAALGALLASLAAAQEGALLEWRELPPLPDPVGVAGAFAGACGDSLVVLGGASFPGGPPWEGHDKVWHGDGYVLAGDAGSWTRHPDVLAPTAYGVSLTWDDALLAFGGGDGDTHDDAARLVRLKDGVPVLERLPDLPGPCAFGTGALLGDAVHLLGGLAAPDDARPLRVHWRLDLARAERGWEVLEPWPGPPRMLAVAGAQRGGLHLIGGVDLEPDGERMPLTDAYRWDAEGGWRRVTGPPRPVTAAPSPAPAIGPHHLAVVGGDAGGTQGPPESHPGFRRDVLVYSALTDAWTTMGRFPEDAPPPVTTPVVPWRDGFVLASGEARPGVRTPRVWHAVPRSRRAGFGGLDWTVLSVYLAALVAMGAWFARRGRTTDDFFLAGRRIPWWAAGISIFGTQLSAITFMAIPGKSYDTDWVYLLQNLGIVAIAPLVTLVYLPRFRQGGATTAYAYLERRFGLGARLFGSASFIAYQLARMGVVLCLPALALEAVTGMDVELCIVLMGVLATAYTVMGGIEAVIWTDVLQVVVLIGGALLVLVTVAAGIEGGMPAVAGEAYAAGKLNLADLSWDWTRPTLAVILLGAVFNNLVPYTTDQAVVQRYLTTRDEASARRAIWTNAGLSVPASLLFFGLGSALFVHYAHHPGRADPAAPIDQVLPWFVAGELPAGVAGLVIAGVFAAAMSSLDSSMNSIATAGVTDFHRRFRPEASDAFRLRLARRLTLLLGTLGIGAALLLARTELGSLLDTFLALLGLLGGCLAGLFALGLFTRRTDQAAALAGVAAGVAVLAYVRVATPVSGLLYAAIGAGTTFVVGVLATALPGARATGAAR